MNDLDDAIRELEAFKDTDAEIEGLVPVRARVSREPGIVFSVRLSGDDYKLIQDAAQSRDLKVGPFMRLAALAAASGDLKLERGEREELIAMIRGRSRQVLEQMQDLEEVVERL